MASLQRKLPRHVHGTLRSKELWTICNYNVDLFKDSVIFSRRVARSTNVVERFIWKICLGESSLAKVTMIIWERIIETIESALPARDYVANQYLMKHIQYNTFFDDIRSIAEAGFSLRV